MNADHKQMRNRLSQQGLCRCKKNSTDSMHKFITKNESFVHHFTPESKQQYKQLIDAGRSAMKKAKTISLVGKVMTSIFKRIILIDCIKKLIRNTRQIFLTIKMNNKKIKRKCFDLKKILFCKNTHRPKKSSLSVRKLRDFKYKLLENLS